MSFPNVHPSLERAIAAQGYNDLTPVQAAVMADDAADKDLLVSAQTGSGKTVAYGLAFASTLLGMEERLPRSGPPLALIIAPTRELAMQVSRELTWLYASAGADIVTCVGGMDAQRERRALSQGAHIVVATPGRLRDHLERGNIDLSALKVVVLDEADEMLDLGFREDLEEILDASPEDRRTLLFSATIAKDIATLARKFQKNAVRIDTVNRDEPHRDIEYRAIRVAPNELEHAVVNVLRFYEAPGALVFCGTRESVRHLHASLRERGFAVVSLSGELSQKERTDALQALRDGRARVCVATDVAARGLDLPDLGLVIHAELPQNKAALLHRSGRTGRAGRKGVSVLLVPYTRRRKAEGLLASANIDAAWAGPPSAEEIRAKDQARWLADPMLTEPANEEEAALAQALMEARSPTEIATALVRLNRSNSPAPEDLFDDDRMRDTQVRERDARPSRDTNWSPERARPERPDRMAPEEVSWFRLSVGRENNADPKWLIPLICRRGHVTKPDIGQIRIFDKETKFEIAKHAETRFLAAIEAAGDADGKIERSSAPTERSTAPRGAKPAGAGYKGDRPKPDFKPKDEFKPRYEAPVAQDAGVPSTRAPEDAPLRPAGGGYKGSNFKADYDPRADKPASAFKPKGEFKPKGDRPAGAGGGYKGANPKPGYKGKADFKPRGESSGGGYKGSNPKPDYKPRDDKPKGEIRPRGEFKPRADAGAKGPFKAKGDAPGKAFKGKPKPKSKSNAGPKPRYDH